MTLYVAVYNNYNEQILESPHTANQGMPRVGVLYLPPSSDYWFYR